MSPSFCKKLNVPKSNRRMSFDIVLLLLTTVCRNFTSWSPVTFSICRCSATDDVLTKSFPQLTAVLANLAMVTSPYWSTAWVFFVPQAGVPLFNCLFLRPAPSFDTLSLHQLVEATPHTPASRRLMPTPPTHS